MAHAKVASNYKVQQRPKNTAGIINANFPVYQSLKNIRLANLNRFLSFALASTMLFSIGMYSFVVSKQKHIEAIHFATKNLNNENLDLQSKLDYLRSFDNVNEKIMASGNLQQPIKIIEVNTKIPDINVKVSPKSKEIGSMLGY
jgi:hypothetical protein